MYFSYDLNFCWIPKLVKVYINHTSSIGLLICSKLWICQIDMITVNIKNTDLCIACFMKTYNFSVQSCWSYFSIIVLQNLSYTVIVRRVNILIEVHNSIHLRMSWWIISIVLIIKINQNIFWVIKSSKTFISCIA
jgi:hypothetical protein